MPVRIRLLATLALALAVVPAAPVLGCEECEPALQVIEDGVAMLPPVPPPATDAPVTQVIEDPVAVLPPSQVAEPGARRAGRTVSPAPTTSRTPRPEPTTPFVMPSMGVGHNGRYPI